MPVIIYIYCRGESNRTAIQYGGTSKLAAEYVAASQKLPLTMFWVRQNLSSTYHYVQSFENAASQMQKLDWFPMLLEEQSTKKSMDKLDYTGSIRSIVDNCPRLRFCYDLAQYLVVRDGHGGGWSRKINVRYLHTLMVYL